jgi:hypothetical protein
MKNIKQFNEFVSQETGIQINENYGKVLDNLQKQFDEAVKLMRGSSILSENGPISIWIDFGVRNQFCDEDGKLLKPLK